MVDVYHGLIMSVHVCVRVCACARVCIEHIASTIHTHCQLQNLGSLK